MSSAAGGSNLAHRALSACVFVPAVLACAWYGGRPLFLLVALVVGRGSWELLTMARQAGYHPASVVGVVLALTTCGYMQVRGIDEGFFLLLSGAMLVCLVAALRRGVQRYLANALFSFACVAYVSVLGSAPLLLSVRLGQLAPVMLIAIFGCIWLTDAAAYGGGRLLGERRLAPFISPGKTVAGFVCGIAGGLVPLVLLSYLPGWTLPEFAGLLMLVAISGQIGDLVESAIKRDLGVKDAPTFIPGHGGVLDRFDSYFFAFPVALAYTVMLKG